MKKYLPFLICLFILSGIQIAGAQELVLGAGDVFLEQRYDGGFHLFIKKKPGLGSVLVTESTRDPQLVSANYAYRAAEWNPVNGDEIRLLDGRQITAESGIFSLISSTPVNHRVLGEAFHIFIPWILQFGYESGRHGEIYVANGTYLNLRTFSLPYGDYNGAFQDNPFILTVRQRPNESPPGVYMKEAVDAFREIASEGKGQFLYSKGSDDLALDIQKILENDKDKTVDIVICLDTTESMSDSINGLRRSIVPMLRSMTAAFKDYRLGLVLFKDYYEEYLNRVIPFTKDFNLFQRNLDGVRARGGGDVPEAVYEALYEGAVRFQWEAESRHLILIGDAPPHPKPRGKITKDDVNIAVEERIIKVSAIIVP